ncbi:type I phosphomannose isomerase catalytic subunit [Sinomicrobium weinanense]|uniref:Phosphohexomutase n=1 Tax=Sinomicrobium weinanense TaxID=2842200 RepID=A0A926JU93_9FLAO|nr:type I phosphomannose isomerase catalytic subunit [Sinomicrobium weinanense]MBC9797358.1 mannose-6-phosphate isomerase [Sinomicrobium weinanense]MBU3123411.1 mannose-6-phosphate isomerase [Sinomicrobium weinanense]
MKSYPIKFIPILKERLWGGTKLKDVLEKDIDNDITGESWELSAVKGDVSVVANGEYKGKGLQELIDTYGAELLGKSVAERFGTEFPILIKFIDAKQDLSIQLHPNDELARERHNSFGKTEMWYIMQADEGSELIVGFNKNVTKEEYTGNLEKNTLTDILNYEKVKEGDTFFINTGKVHAIGAGILLAEIQQTSDITYRIYDFNRKDKNGNTRELHTDLALDAIDYEKKDDFKVKYTREKNVPNTMVECPYFTTNYIDVEGHLEHRIAARDSFSIYMCVDGEAEIATGEGKEKIQKGETILIPAGTDIVNLIADKAKLLEVYIG